MTMQLTNVLILSSLLFGFGIFMVVSRRNAIGALLGIFLILNSAILNVVAFSRFSNSISQTQEGTVFAMFIMAIVIAEMVVGLALIVAMYRKFGSIEPDAADGMKG